jgi:hypothetical protein
MFGNLFSKKVLDEALEAITHIEKYRKVNNVPFEDEVRKLIKDDRVRRIEEWL